MSLQVKNTKHKSTQERREIRRQLGHPVLDADGHVLESTPLLADFLRS